MYDGVCQPNLTYEHRYKIESCFDEHIQLIQEGPFGKKMFACKEEYSSSKRRYWSSKHPNWEDAEGHSYAHSLMRDGHQ
ncbi:MAG: hypothetical protein Ct9H90mP16_11280 [Candidatus Poseidoniales archaeon]|nr:MAG: hypothetical protein Ct9H90mP16_11280 [Candidatus Poseidoniales archaeon]